MTDPERPWPQPSPGLVKQRPARSPNALPATLIVIGALVLVAGIGMYSVPAGVITLAVELIAAGVLTLDVGNRRGREKDGGS